MNITFLRNSSNISIFNYKYSIGIIYSEVTGEIKYKIPE